MAEKTLGTFGTNVPYVSLGGKVAQIGVNFGFAHIPRMLFSAEIFDVTNDPIAVGILGAVRVMMITKYLSDLIHKLYAGIGSEFSFVFHDIDKIS